MNIQFSLTAGTGSIKPDASASSDSALVGMVPASRGTKELGNLEQQGVQVTTGQEELIKRIEKAFKTMEGPQTMLDISIHDKTHQIMVKVLNKETGELIREVPSEKMVDLVAKMMELAGAIVDERI